MAKIEVDLTLIKRFEKSDDSFKLTKIGSKRASQVGVGQYETGDFSLVTIPESSQGPEGMAAVITGYGFNGGYLRTSPIVKIVDSDENSTTFETEGGVYKLEKYSGM